MEVTNKATRIQLFDFTSPQMRAFHMSWMSFFLAFFGWFGVAPLMPVIREDLGLSKTQIGNIIIASVAITILVRILIGILCDKFGPRLTYTWLLIIGSLPVMGIGLSHDYTTFLLARLAIGAIGASFVITQYHTSVMFAPNVVGTANATSAGWGNLGGGVTQLVMPIIFSALVFIGMHEFLAWRVAMVIPGVALFMMGIFYYFLTQDAPQGNYKELRNQGLIEKTHPMDFSAFFKVMGDYRVWALFVLYGACFGVELTINNVAAIYFFDYFSLDLKTAGLIASLFGLMNLFARTLGGFFSDRFALSRGLRGRVMFLFIVVLCEGLVLILFSQLTLLWAVILSLIVFSLFVQMSEGATFGLVPFINRRALGPVAGIVGAGGNAGAVAAGFLFRSESLETPEAFFILGIVVTLCSLLTIFVSFPSDVHEDEKDRLHISLAERKSLEKI